MKNKKLAILKKSSVISKRILLSFPRIQLNTILLVTALAFSLTSMAQRQENVENFSSSKSVSQNVSNINVVFNTGKVYINWMVKGETNDGIYLVERSTDGKSFSAIGFKEVMASRLELLYSWIDHEPISGAAYYRLSRVGINNQPEIMTAALPVMNSDGKQKVSTASIQNLNNN